MTTTSTFEPHATPRREARLYILARTDIYQMNPGKLAAQAAHAATKFVFEVMAQGDPDLVAAMFEWADQGGGFGTKITLAATQDEILDMAERAVAQGFSAGVVVDPSYPFTNHFGEFFTTEELTCGWVFVPAMSQPTAMVWNPDLRRANTAQVLADLKMFSLHP